MWFFHKDASHFVTDEDLYSAMTTASDFAYTSRMTCGVSFDNPHYDIMTGFFSPCTNTPRSGAQQILRIRNFALKTGFFSVANDFNAKVMAKPLDFDDNKQLCLSREDFSLNILDDWGTKLKSLRVRTPPPIRSLFYHISNEKSLSGRPTYYNKLLKHWNTETGFTVRGYDEFVEAIPITRLVNLLLGSNATNIIAAMSGSFPPYWEPLSNLERENLVTRSLLGTRPDYNSITLITVERYALLSRSPVAAVTTEEYWEMRKFEYYGIFANIPDIEKADHWVTFRDSRQRVLNIQKEFATQISHLESLSNYKWTLRAGGQDLRSRQLSEIRTICRILKLSTLHGNHGLILGETLLQEAKEYVYRNRQSLSAIFEFKPHINDLGKPHPWLPKKTIALISRDPMLYTLNRIMKLWGFIRVKRKQRTYIPKGRPPFTKKDSTRARFQKFLSDNPQFSAIVSNHQTNTVVQRKKFISLCQKKWRTSRSKRRMTYCHTLVVSKGDLFTRVFSPLTWASSSAIVMSQLIQEATKLHGEDVELSNLSLFDFEKSVWDNHAEDFFATYSLSLNKDFWQNWRREHDPIWRSKFVSTIYGRYSKPDIYMLIDDS